MTSTSPKDESVTEQVKGEIDSLVKKDVDSVDSGVRYAAYGARLRTALRASSRYVAYVSGPQPFPIARSRGRVHTLDQRRWGSFPSNRSPKGCHRRVRHFLGLPGRVSIVTSCLKHSKVYSYPLYSDIGYEGYKAYQRGPSPIEAANFSEPTRIGFLVAKRAVFQSIASMCVRVPAAWDIQCRDKNVALITTSICCKPGPSPPSRFTPR